MTSSDGLRSVGVDLDGDEGTSWVDVKSVAADHQVGELKNTWQ